MVIFLLTSLHLQENDEDWATRIQCHKFRWYNSQWLDMVEEAENIDTMGGEEMAGGEGLGHSFLHHSDVLDHQGMYSGKADEDRLLWRHEFMHYLGGG